MTTLVIARLTFREAGRRKILLAALLLGLVYLVIYGLGFYFVDQDVNSSQFGPGLLELNQIHNFLFMAGLYVVNFLTVMMAVLTSVDTLSGEIASGTIHTLVSKVPTLDPGYDWTWDEAASIWKSGVVKTHKTKKHQKATGRKTSCHTPNPCSSSAGPSRAPATGRAPTISIWSSVPQTIASPHWRCASHTTSSARSATTRWSCPPA